ncbi:collagen alpha-1(I) chain-like [Manacus candei]|uniref:collagen alpha-1(I) chain-like n=2 Tax=Manacus candei TaxID=415023 RepID=UPI002227C11B|nr:collagen alpha-1(I) chain-like [Manacus candei]
MAPRGCLPRCRPRGSVRPRGRARRPPPPPPPPARGPGFPSVARHRTREDACGSDRPAGAGTADRRRSSPRAPRRRRTAAGRRRRRRRGGPRAARKAPRPGPRPAAPPLLPAAGGGSEEPPPPKAPSRAPPRPSRFRPVARRAPTAPLAPRAPRGPPALAASEPPRPLARARGEDGEASEAPTGEARRRWRAAGRRATEDEKEGRARGAPRGGGPAGEPGRPQPAGRRGGEGRGLGANSEPRRGRGEPGADGVRRRRPPGLPRARAGTRAPAGRPHPALRRGTDRRRTGAEGRAGLRGGERAQLPTFGRPAATRDSQVRPSSRRSARAVADPAGADPRTSLNHPIDLGFPGAARRVMGITPPDRQSASFMDQPGSRHPSGTAPRRRPHDGGGPPPSPAARRTGRRLGGEGAARARREPRAATADPGGRPFPRRRGQGAGTAAQLSRRAASRGLATSFPSRGRARHAAGRGSAGADPPPRPTRPAGRPLGRAAPPDVLEETATRRGGRGPVPEAPFGRGGSLGSGRRHGDPLRSPALPPHRRPALLAAGTHGRHPEPGRHRHLACSQGHLKGSRGRAAVTKPGTVKKPLPGGRGDTSSATGSPRAKETARPEHRPPPRHSAGHGGAPARRGPSPTPPEKPHPSSLGERPHGHSRSACQPRGGRPVPPEAADAGGPHAVYFLHGSPGPAGGGCRRTPGSGQPALPALPGPRPPPQSGATGSEAWAADGPRSPRRHLRRAKTPPTAPRGHRLSPASRPSASPGKAGGRRRGEKPKGPRKKHARLSLAVLATAARGSGRGPRPSLPSPCPRARASAAAGHCRAAFALSLSLSSSPARSACCGLRPPEEKKKKNKGPGGRPHFARNPAPGRQTSAEPSPPAARSAGQARPHGPPGRRGSGAGRRGGRGEAPPPRPPTAIVRLSPGLRATLSGSRSAGAAAGHTLAGWRRRLRPAGRVPGLGPRKGGRTKEARRAQGSAASPDNGQSRHRAPPATDRAQARPHAHRQSPARRRHRCRRQPRTGRRHPGPDHLRGSREAAGQKKPTRAPPFQPRPPTARNNARRHRTTGAGLGPAHGKDETTPPRRPRTPPPSPGALGEPAAATGSGWTLLGPRGPPSAVPVPQLPWLRFRARLSSSFPVIGPAPGSRPSAPRLSRRPSCRSWGWPARGTRRRPRSAADAEEKGPSEPALLDNPCP